MGRRDQLTARIERVEARIAEIDQRFCEPDYYEVTDPQGVAALDQERVDLSEELDRLIEDWDRIERELEALT